MACVLLYRMQYNACDMTRSPQHFGRMLKKFRLKIGFSQRQLADKTTVPYSLISALENGKRTAGEKIAFKLVSALGLQGTLKEDFLESAKLTSKRIRLSIPDETEKQDPSLWLKFLKFLVPSWEIKEICFSPTGVYDMRITRTDLSICGVAFVTGKILLVSNPGLDGGLADTQAIRNLVQEAEKMEANRENFRSLVERGMKAGIKMEIFGKLGK